MYATALREAIDDCGLDNECVLKAKSNGTLIVEKMWDRSIEGENNLLGPTVDLQIQRIANPLESSIDPPA